jgi:hypothetical protein
MGAVAYVTARLTTGPGETTNLKVGETVVFAPTVWVTTTFGVATAAAVMSVGAGDDVTTRFNVVALT